MSVSKGLNVSIGEEKKKGLELIDKLTEKQKFILSFGFKI